MKRTPLDETLLVTKALSDRQRLRILMLLAGGELCVCQVVAVIDLAASTISKHLSILAGAGLVVPRKDGRWVHYRLAPDALALGWLRAALARDASVRSDRDTLKRIKQRAPEDLCRQQRPS
jgi:DNA-binding transcriptional ArsR family regulator